ncbi:MAG: glycine cleavage system protein GcvH [Actinobacteria bacterium]|nr:glycine cleavage system protein GcvH [Actinomycetota bacterium]
MIPDQLRYTKEHEWVAATDSAGIFRMGITDFAQSALGDIVYIQMPKPGEEVTIDKICGEVESTKSVSEIYAPVTGKIAFVNDLLNKNPELINSDCYGQGWIAEIEVVDISVIEKLLSAQQYQELTA